MIYEGGTMSDEDLNTCPFCGGEAEFDYTGVPDGRHSVSCCECSYSMDEHYPSKEMAADAWELYE